MLPGEVVELANQLSDVSIAQGTGLMSSASKSIALRARQLEPTRTDVSPQTSAHRLVLFPRELEWDVGDDNLDKAKSVMLTDEGRAA